MKITKSLFGQTKEGTDVELYTLSNDHQVTVKITNYGAIITSIVTPDSMGNLDNIACGFDKLEDYQSAQYLGSYPYFGCVCGRVCNRIANGKFSLEGIDYTLAVNNGPNHLHGGLVGFDRRIWNAEIFQNDEFVGVKLHLLSPHMEEGYPGNLNVTCLYTLNNNNELTMEYTANTDQTTIINLTNHTYFNLTGGKNNILDHELELKAKTYTEYVDAIPTGKIVSVEGTPFDFLEKKKLSRDIASLPEGYDLNFVLDNEGDDFIHAATLSEATSGRTVNVFTTQPGIQLYTGFWIPELTIDGVKKFGKYSGVALETQHYPDSINKPHFPSVVLKPGQHFYERTSYIFGKS